METGLVTPSAQSHRYLQGVAEGKYSHVKENTFKLNAHFKQKYFWTSRLSLLTSHDKSKAKRASTKLTINLTTVNKYIFILAHASSLHAVSRSVLRVVECIILCSHLAGDKWL